MSLAASTEKELLSTLLFSKDNHPTDSTDRSNIIIIGGELFNKGAQAMTFTVVDQMSKRFPEKDIILLSGRDYQRSTDEKSQYTFEILPWGAEIQLPLLSPSMKYFNTTEFTNDVVEQIHEALENCSFLIDINGYAFSSQCSFRGSIIYINNIIIARKFGMPMYIFPQSIGPFDYEMAKKQVINPLMETYLQYPEVICPREVEGVESLTPYTRDNVQREFDIVLQKQGYDIRNIYLDKPNLRYEKIQSDAVGIVPNSKVFEHADHEDLYSLYDAAIEKLLSENRTIYILRHSVEDLDLCRNIKRQFRNNERVILLEDELNAIELEHIINQFDFLIGSRYHSLIHAYKNHTPVITIGWAIKYKSLLRDFNQGEYFFEGREKINEKEFTVAVSKMSEQYSRESSTIETKLKIVQQNNLFNRLFDK